MKVYGGIFILKGRQVRGIICGTQKQVAEVTRSSLSYIRAYWSETGNAVELEVAKSNVGKLFWTENNLRTKTKEDYQLFEGR